MHDNLEPHLDPVDWGPLTFHVRRLRQWYGESGLSQGQLAELAGISPRLLRQYEARRDLPQTLGCLLALALALEVPIEWLIAPEIVEQAKAAVEARRRGLKFTRRRRPMGLTDAGHDAA